MRKEMGKEGMKKKEGYLLIMEKNVRVILTPVTW